MADQEEGSNAPAPEVVTEARNMGWVPLEEFKGNQEHWVDADAFVERGRQVMPILIQNNKRLQRELLTRDQKIGTLETNLESVQATMKSLENSYGRITKQAVQEAKARLREELKQAREDDDLDKELDIQDQMRALDATPVTSEQKTPVKKPTTQTDNSNLSPEFVKWEAANPWFGVDKKKTREVTRIAEDLRDEGIELTGIDFMNECVRVYEEKHGDAGGSTNTPASKVESGSGRRTATGSDSFAALPQAAKQACHEDAEMLVGEGKRYKTMKDWETAYAKIYNGQA